MFEQTYAGLKVSVVDAQKQARTSRDIRGPWVRPKVPSKRDGRRGTRRAWKQKNAPHFVMLYREPDGVLRFGDQIIVTPKQWALIKQRTSEPNYAATDQ